MNRLFVNVRKRDLSVILGALFVVALLAAASAVEIPTGKTSDDFVAEAKAHVEGISPEQTKQLIDGGSGVVLLDIRTFEEFEEHGWIAGRTVLPHGMVIFKITEVVPDKAAPIIVYCKKGKRSTLVAYQLHQMGYENVKYLEGGILVWKRKRFPTESSGVSKIAEDAVVPRGDLPTGKSAADFVAEANKAVRALNPTEAKQRSEAPNAVILDIRTAEEIGSQGAIGGAMVMEHGKVIFNIKKKVHDANSPIVVVCEKGGRSALIAQQLQEIGYKDVHHVKGGIIAWKQAGLPLR